MTSYDKNDPATIQALFNSIAKRYDFGNALLSGNMHRLWNRSLVTAVVQNSPQNVLDLCAGTGEIARLMAKKLSSANYHLVDFSEEMLAVAKKRLQGDCFSFYQCDAQKLLFDAAHFDAVSCAYGIRNIKNRAKCFSELYRVMRPHATVAIVELTRPQGSVMKALHKAYLAVFVPAIGRLITSNKEAYQYLSNSIEAFIPAQVIVEELVEAGFTDVTSQPLTFGIATLFTARKP